MPCKHDRFTLQCFYSNAGKSLTWGQLPSAEKMREQFSSWTCFCGCLAWNVAHLPRVVRRKTKKSCLRNNDIMRVKIPLTIAC